MGAWSESSRKLPRHGHYIADSVKFQKIEAAIHVLAQARDYLYQGLKHVGTEVEQRVSAEKMQDVATAMGEIVERLKLTQGFAEDRCHIRKDRPDV